MELEASKIQVSWSLFLFLVKVQDLFGLLSMLYLHDLGVFLRRSTFWFQQQIPTPNHTPGKTSMSNGSVAPHMRKLGYDKTPGIHSKYVNCCHDNTNQQTRLCDS